MKYQKKIKEIKMMPKTLKELTMTEYIFKHTEKQALVIFKKLGKKYSIDYKLFFKKYKDTFKVCDYNVDTEDEFFNVLWLNVIEPVLIDNGFETT